MLNNDLTLKQNYEYTIVNVSGGLNISITIPPNVNDVIITCAHKEQPWSGTSITLTNNIIQNALGINFFAGAFQNGPYGLGSTLYVQQGVVKLTQYFESSQLVTSDLILTAYYR